MIFWLTLAGVSTATTLEAANSAEISAPAQAIPAATLDDAINAKLEGRHTDSVEFLESWLESRTGPWGQERLQGRFLLGWLYLQANDPNNASPQFTKVRLEEGPLQSLALWYEALSDHQRGRHRPAIKECQEYRSTWPDGEHASSCLLLIGQAQRALGQRVAARNTWTQWVQENPDHPRLPQIQLNQTTAKALAGSRQAIRDLQSTVLRPAYPSLGQQAASTLNSIRESGRNVPDIDPLEQLIADIHHFVSVGDYSTAKETLSHLIERSKSDPAIQEWLQNNAQDIAWKARDYERYTMLAKAQYLQDSNGLVAWRIYRSLQRAGDHYGAGEWAETALVNHGSHRKWRRSIDSIALTWQLAGEYEKALALWDRLTPRRDALGKKARWFRAFSTYRLGHYENALQAFVEIEKSDSHRKYAAIYYQQKIHDLLGQTSQALSLRTKLLEESPMSWYGQLLQAKHHRSLGATAPTDVLHEGLGFEAIPEIQPETFLSTIAHNPATVASHATSQAATSISLGLVADEVSLERGQRPVWERSAIDTEPALPSSHHGNALLDRQADLKSMKAFAKTVEELWPDIEKAYMLARVGIHELASVYVETHYTEWLNAQNNRGPNARNIRALNLKQGEWRAVIHAARDDLHGTRFTKILAPSAATIEQGEDSLRKLRYPTPHIKKIAVYCRQYNVDPLLVLGLMRQESHFRRGAISRVGATGLMQVMPRTASKIAHDLNEVFAPDELHTPRTNLRYGIWYLSKLLRRFEGSWPLAVAAYNAGPMNVSSWYLRWEGQMSLDDFVEHIPFTETRDYVKKVGQNYANYVDLYSPEGRLVLPEKPGHNLPGIISY